MTLKPDRWGESRDLAKYTNITIIALVVIFNLMLIKTLNSSIYRPRSYDYYWSGEWEHLEDKWYYSVNPPNSDLFVSEASAFLEDPPIPVGSRILTEDDILYCIYVMQPDFLAKALALQAFNVMDDSKREKTLNDFEYIYFSKKRGGYYYLKFIDDPSWRNDPFRELVHEIIRTNEPQSIYNNTLVPIENSPSRLILRIQHKSTI